MLSRFWLKPAGGSGKAGLSSGPNSIGPPNPPLPAALPAFCGAAPRPSACCSTAAESSDARAATARQAIPANTAVREPIISRAFMFTPSPCAGRNVRQELNKLPVQIRVLTSYATPGLLSTIQQSTVYIRLQCRRLQARHGVYCPSDESTAVSFEFDCGGRGGGSRSG